MCDCGVASFVCVCCELSFCLGFDCLVVIVRFVLLPWLIVLCMWVVGCSFVVFVMLGMMVLFIALDL